MQTLPTFTETGYFVNQKHKNQKTFLQQIRQSSKESTGSSDTDSTSDDEDIPLSQAGVVIPEAAESKATKETEAGAEISALVNYVQPVHFSSFENSESKCWPCLQHGQFLLSPFSRKQSALLPTFSLFLLEFCRKMSLL